MSRAHQGITVVLSFLLLTISSAAFGSSFKAVGNYAVGNHPVAIAAGDFNRDGKVDLAVANNASKTVSVLLGNGDGTFGKAADYEIGVAPGTLVIDDFNGDGRADIVVADADGSKISVLLGGGDGSFGTHIEMSASQVSPEVLKLLRPQPVYRSGTQSSSVVFADFNGDGQMDQAVAMSGRNLVSVLLNVSEIGSGYINLIENGGFETGSLAPWYQARDGCSGTCDWAVLTVAPARGLYDAGDEGNMELRQDFAATDTGTIAHVVLSIRHPQGAINSSVDFFYSNGDDDEFSAFTTDSGWDSFDLTSDLSAGQTLDGMSVWGYVGGIGAPITFVDEVAIIASN